MSVTNPNENITKQDLADFYQKILPYLGASSGGGGGVASAIIPNMTSNTTPSGEASASSTYTNQPAYKAFNGIANDPWAMANGDSNPWLQYNFGQPVKATAIGYDFYTVPERVTSFSLYGDGNLITTITGPITRGFHKVDLPSDKQGNYSVYRLTFVATGLVHVDTFQLYAVQASNPCDYSTSEKVVGSWIGGETLYQKTLTITCPTVTSGGGSPVYGSTLLGVKTADIGRIVKIEGSMQNGGLTVPVPFINPMGYVVGNAGDDNGDIRVYITTNHTAMSNQDVLLTVQYTKATD